MVGWGGAAHHDSRKPGKSVIAASTVRVVKLVQTSGFGRRATRDWPRQGSAGEGSLAANGPLSAWGGLGGILLVSISIDILDNDFWTIP